METGTRKAVDHGAETGADHGDETGAETKAETGHSTLEDGIDRPQVKIIYNNLWILKVHLLKSDNISSLSGSCNGVFGSFYSNLYL